MTDDAQLLRRYAEEGSETAFGEVVKRYINLVYSAAVRQVHDTQQAEDIVQMVFTALARKARGLPKEVLLSGWLYRHTCFAAAKAARTERRRQARERQAVAMNVLNDDTGPDWEHLAPILDEAMNRLAAPERNAIVLRYFERRDLHSVGAALGVSEEAARKRVTRALGKLRTLFTRRGLTFSTTSLATLLAGQAVVAAPTGLTVSVTSAALASAANSTGMTFTLLKIMTMTKLKAGIVGAIVMACVATPLAIQHQARINLREKSEHSQQLNDQVAHLRAKNERLSNLVAQANSSQSLSKDQLSELLRLRAEVSRLRGDSQELARLKAAKEGTDEGSQLFRVRLFPPGDMAGKELARMRARLNLTSEQVQALRELLLKKAEASYAGTQVPSEERAAELSQSAARAEEQIQSLLTPEQQVAYAELQRDDRAVQARVSANFDLLQIQNLLGLTQEQQGLVAAALYEQQLRQLSGDLLTGSDAESERTVDPTKVMQRRLEQKLKALEPLLTPSQLEAYSQDLKSQLTAAQLR